MLKILAKSTVILGITTAINYALFVLFARVAGAEAFSRYLYDITVSGVLAVMIGYASQRVYTRDVLETGSEQDSFNTIMTLRLVLGGIACVALFIWGSYSNAGSPLAVVFLVFYIFQLNFLFEYFGTNVHLAWITGVEKISFAVVAGTWAILVGFTWHIYLFFLIGSCLALFLQIRMYRGFVTSYQVPPTADLWRYLKQYLNLFLVDLGQLAYGNFSRLIIQQKNGLLEFGATSIGFQIIKVASIFQTQVEYIFRPSIVRLAEARDVGRLLRQSGTYLWMTTLPTIVGSTTLIVFAEPIILHGFGADYALAIPALKIIAVLPVTVNLMRFTEMVLIGLKRDGATLTINIITNLGLLAALVAVPAGSALSFYLWIVVLWQGAYVLALGGLSLWALNQPQSRKTEIL